MEDRNSAQNYPSYILPTGTGHSTIRQVTFCSLPQRSKRRCLPLPPTTPAFSVVLTLSGNSAHIKGWMNGLMKQQLSQGHQTQAERCMPLFSHSWTNSATVTICEQPHEASLTTSWHTGMWGEGCFLDVFLNPH